MPDGLDHFVLTVSSIERTAEFYEGLGASVEPYGDDRWAIELGDQKINLHRAGDTLEPAPERRAVGSADFCLLTDEGLDTVRARLDANDIEVVAGPVERTGARGTMTSLYVTDPDGNLVEIAAYDA